MKNRGSGLPRGVRDRSDIANTINSILGQRLKPLFKRMSEHEAMRVVNPNYGKGNAYSQNCALCTVAAALQFMGYDVEAAPRDIEWRGFDSVFDYKWTPENFKSPFFKSTNYDGVPFAANDANTNRFSSSLPSDVKNEIMSQMKTWGTGSFAAMTTTWDGGGAHTILIYQKATGTRFLDFQIHKAYSPTEWFNTHSNAKPGTIGLYRLDNQKLKSSITSLNKIVRNREDAVMAQKAREEKKKQVAKQWAELMKMRERYKNK